MKTIALAAITLAASAIALAQHLSSEAFDSETTVTVTGTVAVAGTCNPQMGYFIDVEYDGKTGSCYENQPDLGKQQPAVRFRGNRRAESLRL